ncbi:MAG: MFS transporter, partial [Alphaproteobacteria bacterium]
SDEQTKGAETGPQKAPWAELFREGRGFYTVLLILGTALHALQILVIAIIMPTVVGDIGGANYYTWVAMVYTIGSIIGAASVGPVWARLGRRKGYTFSGIALLLATAGCAIAPDMGVLIVLRGVQGFAGGMVTGGGMALVSGLFDERLRTRVLALNQGTWMIAQLMGPLVGGVFAEIGWWRGSFWAMVPLILIFSIVAWVKLPVTMEGEKAATRPGRFPVVRLTMLASGVFCVALAGPVDHLVLRILLIIAAVALIWLTFARDRVAENRLFPSGILSPRSPVGIALWILFLAGGVQTSVNIFLPLLLQVVHGVTPLFISFVSIVISFGWTVGTFGVSGWSGDKERLALVTGPIFMFAGLVIITVTAELPQLAVLTLGALILGFGIGVHNVHLLARTMAAAVKGEERITASALPSIRSLGTAFGAALAGMLSNIGGLGDATDPAAVGAAVTFIYGVELVPLALAVLFMFWLVRLTRYPN